MAKPAFLSFQCPRSGSCAFSVTGSGTTAAPESGDARATGRVCACSTQRMGILCDLLPKETNSMAQTPDVIGRDVLPIPDRPTEGKMALDARDAEFPPIAPLRPPEGAPNVVLVLLDDMGFGAPSVTGGPREMPAMQRIADDGLLYNRFHTTALCSPTRVAMLTGPNHHSAGIGSVAEVAAGAPGNDSVRPNTVAPAHVRALEPWIDQTWRPAEIELSESQGAATTRGSPPSTATGARPQRQRDGPPANQSVSLPTSDPLLAQVRGRQAYERIRCRSTARTRAGAGAGGSGPPRWPACRRSRSRSGPR